MQQLVVLAADLKTDDYGTMEKTTSLNVNIATMSIYPRALASARSSRGLLILLVTPLAAALLRLLGLLYLINDVLGLPCIPVVQCII